MKKKQEICIYHFIFVLLQQIKLQQNGSCSELSCSKLSCSKTEVA